MVTLRIQITLLTLAFCFLAGLASGQNTFSDIKTKEVLLSDSTFNPEVFYENLYLFQDEEIDSSDIDFLIHSEMIHMLLMKVGTDSSQTIFQPFTYQRLKQEFLQIMSIEEYQSSKKTFFKMVDIMNTKPDQEKWVEHEAIFQELEWKQEYITKIKNKVFNSNASYTSYSELIESLD